MAAAAIDDLGRYRDPRTAFGNGDRMAALKTQRIPVGQVIEGAPMPTSAPGPAGAGAAAADIGAMAQEGATGAANAVQAAAKPASLASRVGQAASNFVRSGIPGVAGVVAGTVQRSIDQMPQAPQPAVQAPTGPGQIPVDPNLKAPAATAEPSPLGVGPNNEFTRNVAAAVNAVPGGGQIINAGRISRGLVTAGNAVQQFVRGAQSAPDISALPAAQAQTPPRAPDAAPATGRPIYSDARQGHAIPADIAATTPAPANLAGTITYDPKTKTYSGKDAGFGADIKNADGTMRNAGGIDGKGFGVSSMDTSEGFRQDKLELARNTQAQAQQLAAVQTQPVGIGGEGTTTISQDLRAKTNDKSDRRLPANAGRQEVEMAFRRDQMAQQNADNARQVSAQMRAQDIGYAGQQLAANTQIRGQDIGAASSRYSTDENASARRDVAKESAAARVDAAAERTTTPKVVRGGQVPYADPSTGETKLMTLPDRLVHPVTGEEIGAKPPVKPKISEADAMTQAKAAIAAGADKAAVNKRLAEAGFKAI